MDKGPVSVGSVAAASFSDFRKRKEIERHSKFVPKGKQGKFCKANVNKPKDVTVNIGFMKYENGSLKKCRGKTLPIFVPVTATANLIKEKAVRKHANHDRMIHEGLDYALLYQDGSEVINLPGTTDPFVLEKYKEDLGRNYNRITLFIANKGDFVLSQMPTELSSDEDIIEVSDKEDDKYLESSIFEERVCMASCRNRASGEGTTKAVVEQQTLTAPRIGEGLVECPTCLLSFPLRSIADHADLCADVWVGNPEGDVSVDIEQDHLEDTAQDHQHVTDLKSLVSSLSDKHLTISKPLKLRLRRKNLWADIKTYREKLSPSRKIKVEFIGEPAVDDGGPRGEFFQVNSSTKCY